MSLFKRISLLGAAALMSAAPITLAGEELAGTHTTRSKDIVDTAAAAGTFATLLKAAQAAGLVETLKSDGPLTVFAPNDEAFAKLPAGTVEALLKDKEKLRAILTYHVVSGKVPASKVVGMRWAQTVQGQSLIVRAGKDGVSIDGAKVITADIPASNGIIHVIDRVVIPREDIVDTAVQAGSFKTLVTAVKAAELVETLKGKGPFTVFAPTDAAFGELPEGTLSALIKDKPKLRAILTYHVVAGRVLADEIPNGITEVATAGGGKLRITRDENGVQINGANVIKTDIITGNGVIHVIDGVLLPE
ncbi:MAG: fasciclin domain-containing protein [Planctomycetota bacterium]